MCFVCPAVYHALYLEELTLLDLSEKIALLYSITPQQITHIYRQKSNGIHVLVSDEVSIHLWYQPLIFNTSELSKRALFEGTGVVSSADQDLYLTQGFMTDHTTFPPWGRVWKVAGIDIQENQTGICRTVPCPNYFGIPVACLKRCKTKMWM